VVLIQRPSSTSGWKVEAVNSGRSPIGGIEPDLDRIVAESVSQGLLSASHDYAALRDADVILVCVQTDKSGFGPDYGPLFEALDDIALQLQKKPAGKVPLIIFESTLAPTSMGSLIKERLSRRRLEEGRDILLGNSPNRVMPGHLVDRVMSSDKVIGGLDPRTPELIRSLYSKVVTKGRLHLTNSLTAEIVKTLENAYRDVRIAYSSEVARFCDGHDLDFYRVREEVNTRVAWSDGTSFDGNAVPSGGLLIPTIGVGGHCLPKDGILLLWRMIEARSDLTASLILESRRINDESPAEAVRQAKNAFGDLAGHAIALLGAAYRFNSEDTRNSPSFALARLLLARGCRLIIHDPYVKPDDQNLVRMELAGYFTREVDRAVADAEYIIFGTAHRLYLEELDDLIHRARRLRGIFDGCNLFKRSDWEGKKIRYSGIARGRKIPGRDFTDFVKNGFRAVERGFANEIQSFIQFANDRYAGDEFNRVDFGRVQRIAGTCVTGCRVADPGPVERVDGFQGFLPRLVKCALAASPTEEPPS
jgi:UDP-N-acetyl-D-mannosaminuronic acid dehydrogenase